MRWPWVRGTAGSESSGYPGCGSCLRCLPGHSFRARSWHIESARITSRRGDVAPVNRASTGSAALASSTFPAVTAANSSRPSVSTRSFARGPRSSCPVVPHVPAQLGRFDRPAVHAAGAGGGPPLRRVALADDLPQGVQDPLPGAVVPPRGEAVARRALGRQVGRQVVRVRCLRSGAVHRGGSGVLGLVSSQQITFRIASLKEAEGLMTCLRQLCDQLEAKKPT